MAVSNADVNSFLRALITAFGEGGYPQFAIVIRALKVEFPAVDWKTRLANVVGTWQPFVDSGTSIQWWLDEVDRLSQP